VPCNAGGESDQSTWQCGGSTGEVGEGAQVNYQLGVAWRRYVGSDPGFGTVPPFRSALTLDDRDWNGGSKLILLDPGQCTSHIYETSSFGLDDPALAVVSFPVNPARAVGGQLQPGHHVDIWRLAGIKPTTQISLTDLIQQQWATATLMISVAPVVDVRSASGLAVARG
jgi:hypothetical protein